MFQPSERTPARYSHGPDSSGPKGFGFVVRHRRKVVGWTRDERSAWLLAWALTMSELMADSTNQQFLDWWIAWLGDLSSDSAKGGGRKIKS